MKTINIIKKENKKSILKKTNDWFFVQNTIWENASRIYPFKSYKTIWWAEKYINKFLKD